MFDIDDYPVKQADLKPENYTLSHEELKNYAILVAKLRALVVEKARVMLKLDIN